MPTYKNAEYEAEFELAKFDRRMYELSDEWEMGSGMPRMEAMYAFCKAALQVETNEDAQDYLDYRLDGADFDTIDMTELGQLTLEISMVYSGPTNAAVEKARGQLNRADRRAAFKRIK